MKQVHYACGHAVEDSTVPQDQDWQSEVRCPNCKRGLFIWIEIFIVAYIIAGLWTMSAIANFGNVK